ncbi:hypothetical protein [Legionella feeleii]|uniref:Haem-binding uptake Tiki superfamily ChaN domain-containing protein n=1 Tax=Legionella feeleii TaxID=453 RepID=A0A378KK07_9GAMM|nr:hypothetical protein [Legionella feeleii]STX88236.1 Uncharacterised protein [Legionella feeleii]
MPNKSIIIGEHHEDPSARIFVRQNIQDFINTGLSLFGFEHGEKTNLETEIQWLEEDLNSVTCCLQMAVYVFFNKEYKKMQSNQQLLNLFKTIASHDIEYQGLDIDIGNRWAPEATPQRMWKQLAGLANSNNFNEIIKYRDKIIVTNLLKHADKKGIHIVGLLHLKGIQELLIQQKGEAAVRNNYEFVVIKGKTLSEQDIHTFAQNIPIPACILNSDTSSEQFNELFNYDKSMHLKME